MKEISGSLSIRPGSKVEVCNGQGAWLTGKILDETNTNPLPLYLRKRKSQFLVQYDTLVEENDPSEPLTEHVEVGSLRPSPPVDNADVDAVLEVGDVVDAFNLDAWWPGLVMSVVGEKYKVGFKSPPDLLELGRGELRRHCDWRGGEWIRAQKEMMTPVIFSPGDDVEVNLHKDRIWYSWIPATYVGPLGDNCYLVQYKSAYNCDENGFVKQVVSDHQIRPCPPQQEERAFELMTMVDAYHEMCWWVGDITKMLTGGKYSVTFRFSKHEKKFNKSDLRLHMEWIGSKWVTDPKALEDKIVSEETSKYASSYRNSSKERTPGSTKSWTKQSTLFVDESPNGNAKNKLKTCQHPKDGSTKSQTKQLTHFVDVSPNGNAKNKLKTCQHPKDGSTKSQTKQSTLFVDVSPNGNAKNTLKSCQHPKDGSTKSQTKQSTLFVDVSPNGNAKNKLKTCQHPKDGSTKSQSKQSTLFVDVSPNGNAKNTLKSCQHPKDGAPFSSPTPSKKLKGEHSEDSLPLANLLAKTTPDKPPKTTPDKPPKKRGPFRDGEKSEQQEVAQLDSETRTQIKKRGRERKSEIDSPSPSVRLGKKARTARSRKIPGKKTGGSDKEFEQVEHVINGIISSSIMGESHAGSSSVLPKVDSENGDISGRNVMAQPEFHVKHSKDLTPGSEDPVRDGPAIPSVLEIQQAVSGIPAKEEGHSTKTREGTTNQQNGVKGGQHENGVNGDMEREDNPNLPFVKSLPLWKSIESMEEFKKFPQNPHFQPLLKQKEVFREGSALGKMLAFTSLVDQTSKLRVDDPRDVIDSNLEATVELELHGFDVNAMKHRLTELLGLKVKLEELHSQSKLIETTINQTSNDSIKDTEMIGKLEKEIEELQKKRALLVSRCAAKDSEISSLQSQANVINELIQTAQRGFDIVAAAPL